MTIGERIKELRTKKGLTQKQLAAQTGLSEISIRKYEADERRPKIETIKKISIALDSYIGYFLSGYYGEYIDEIKEDFSIGIKKSDPPQILSDTKEEKGDLLINDAPAINARDERDIKKDLESLREKLAKKEMGPAAYDGDDISEEDMDLFLGQVELMLRRLKTKNKEKYNPRKNKK